MFIRSLAIYIFFLVWGDIWWYFGGYFCLIAMWMQGSNLSISMQNVHSSTLAYLPGPVSIVFYFKRGSHYFSEENNGTRNLE